MICVLLTYISTYSKTTTIMTSILRFSYTIRNPKEKNLDKLTSANEVEKGELFVF